MKVAMITAGAAGMYCGSCMHDNTLAAAVRKLGHDALLIPTYTPIRTDEADVSQSRVFFGGVNVYLQQKSFLFRYTPRLLDRLLDLPRLLRWVSRFATSTKTEDLGDLTISMLLGKDGYQRKEVARLVDWLAADIKPELITLTNVLLSGIVPEVKRRTDVPVLAHLQGDDIFLEGLRPSDRMRCKKLIRKNCEAIDGYLVTSEYYADFMADYLDLPRDRMRVVYPGLSLAGHGGDKPARPESPLNVGYFARICPEKGLHNMVDAYIALRQLPDVPPTRLRISGWLGDHMRDFLAEQTAKLEKAGLADEVDHVDSPSHADKVAFLQSLDVMSVPTTYREPKGLYLLEAWANGVPVVQPRHGSFPELVEATGGGVLVNPDDPAALAAGLRRVLLDGDARRKMGEAGRAAVFGRFHDAQMAEETAAVFEQFAAGKEAVA